MTGTTTVVNRRARQHFDFPLLIITYALAIFGVFAITVATYKYTGETLAVDTLLARITSSYYGKRQGLFLLVSPIAILVLYFRNLNLVGNFLWLIIIESIEMKSQFIACYWRTIVTGTDEFLQS